MTERPRQPAVRGLDRLRTRVGAALSAVVAFAAGAVLALVVTRVG